MFTREFAAGTYRLVILPQAVDAKIVTLLQRLEEPAPIAGHGPHDLTLSQLQGHQWIEPEEGGVRVPTNALPFRERCRRSCFPGLRSSPEGRCGFPGSNAAHLGRRTRQTSRRVKAQTFLRLKTTTPVIAQVTPVGGTQQLAVFPNGADFGLLLPKGTTPLVLRAVDDGPLAGVAEATLIDIAPIGEGLGPKVRLTPGESRLYSFTVTDERDIGVGVRGSTDSAHCRVLDAAGTEIGAGVVQMLHLKAGTYLLAVDAPAEGTAIEVQPALVGIAAPDGSPPDDVKRAYLALAGLEPQLQE